MRIEEFLSQLERVRGCGGGYQARCPAHRDHNPSLSIREGTDGRILVKDHAGCSVEQIVQAMGSTTADLFSSDQRAVTVHNADSKPLNTGTPAPIDLNAVDALHRDLPDSERQYLIQQRRLSESIIDCYHIGFEIASTENRFTLPILDEQDKCLDIRRWLPPESRSSSSAKMLHWRTGYGASRLFPLDQLSHDSIVLCEGEMDALALVSTGIPAIAATCGATTWLSSLSASFSNKTVTILMDNDEAGKVGAEKRAENLHHHGAEVKMAEWPSDCHSGWDVTDELHNFGLDRLRNIIACALLYTSANAKEASEQMITADWLQPQPLPSIQPSVEPFQSQLLPRALRCWIEDISERMQCPPDFPAIAAMVTLSAVVGRQVGIRPQQHDDWLVVPNLWGAVIGPPGVMKTLALQEPLRPLEKLEKRAKVDFDTACHGCELSSLVAEAKRKQVQEEILKALKEDRPLDDIGIKGLESGEPAPMRQRYLVNDTTIEKIGEIVKHNPRGILIFRDELTGFLKTLDKEGRESDKGFYLESWNRNGRFTYDRIGRGTIDIEAASVSILAQSQSHTAVNAHCPPISLISVIIPQLPPYPILGSGPGVCRWNCVCESLTPTIAINSLTEEV